MASAQYARFSRPLVEMKAGKCSRDGRMVVPDPRKGLLYLETGEDDLMNLCWKDRTTNIIEDKWVIFGGEIDIERVEQSPGRVYVLKFKTSSHKLFFWMQEPKESRDASLIKLLSEKMGGGGETELTETAIASTLRSTHDDGEEGITSNAQALASQSGGTNADGMMIESTSAPPKNSDDNASGDHSGSNNASGTDHMEQ